MGTQIKNILSVNVPPVTEVDVPHELNVNGIPVVPDVIFSQQTSVTITADDINIKIFNPGPDDLLVTVLAEHWHTIERAFGDAATLQLSPQPFVILDEATMPTPAFSNTTRTIFARLTGSDSLGRGTLAKPYRTFQRAIRDIPNIIPPGVRYEADYTGIGEETLPDDFVLPSWKSAEGVSGYDFDDEFFYTFSAVRLRADPQLASALSAANQVVTVANGVWNPPDPNTGLGSLTDVTKTWVPGALKGLFVVGSGGVFEKSIIYDNTATTIFTTEDGGFYTFPVKIMEPSAVLDVKADDPFAFGRVGLFIGHQDSLVIAGTEIRPTVPESLSFGTIAGTVFYELCRLVNGIVVESDGFVQLTSCDVVGGFYGAHMFMLASRCSGGTNFNPAQSDDPLGGFSFVIDGCAPVGKSVPSNLFFFGGLIINALSDGVRHVGNGILGNVDIKDSVGNAIFCDGNAGVLRCSSVKGTGNGGLGIRVNDGQYILVDVNTDVVGAEGEMKVGVLPPRTWDNFRNTGIIIGNEYDIAAPPTGSTTTSTAITGATNTAPIVITAVAHGLFTGDRVTVSGVTGLLSANGTWIINVTGVNTFQLIESDGTEDDPYAGGGTVDFEDGGTSGSRLYQTT